ATCDMPFARAISPNARAIPATSSGASLSHASKYAAISSGVRSCSATSYGTVFILRSASTLRRGALEVRFFMIFQSKVTGQLYGGLDVLLLRCLVATCKQDDEFPLTLGVIHPVA